MWIVNMLYCDSKSSRLFADRVNYFTHSIPLGPNKAEHIQRFTWCLGLASVPSFMYMYYTICFHWYERNRSFLQLFFFSFAVVVVVDFIFSMLYIRICAWTSFSSVVVYLSMLNFCHSRRNDKNKTVNQMNMLSWYFILSYRLFMFSFFIPFSYNMVAAFSCIPFTVCSSQYSFHIYLFFHFFISLVFRFQYEVKYLACWPIHSLISRTVRQR